MTPFRPNLSSNRSIRFSSEQGVDRPPIGEGVLMPKPPRPPSYRAMVPPKIVVPKIKKSGKRYYGME